MPDIYGTATSSLMSPLIGGFSIAPSDNGELAQVTRQIRVTGSGGNLSVLWLDGSTSIEPVQANETLDWRIRRVNATGTTAAGIRGYY